MDTSSPIFVAGHKGLLGSVLTRELERQGFQNILTRTRAELDLKDTAQTLCFFEKERPEYVFLAAAKVGGIKANMEKPWDFIHENIAIQNSVIPAALACGTQRLIFFGSTCAYPKQCPQPMKEEYIMSGPVEPTSAPYAAAKTAGMAMCEAASRQHGVLYFSMIPSTLYGPGDNFAPGCGHVMPALIAKLHTAKLRNETSITLWGTGTPLREFLHAGDMARACILLMNMDEARLRPALEPRAFRINSGSGIEISIQRLAVLTASVIGYKGEILFDRSMPDGAPRKLLDSSAIKGMGWTPMITLEEGIKTTYDWYVSASGATLKV